MLKHLRYFIDKFVPEEDKLLAVEHRNARFFISTLIVFILSGIPNAFYFFTTHAMVPLIGSLCGIIVGIVLIAVHRKFGQRTVLINLMNVLMFSLIGYLIYHDSGGIYSSDLLFLIVTPVWTFFLAGKRSGIAWFVVSTGLVIFYYISDIQHPGVFMKTMQTIPPDYSLMNFMLGAIFIFFTVLVHQSNSDTYAAEISEQKHIIEVKNKEILDSIAYAKRLQEAILPPLEHVREVFNDFFILYKPKDIVAGDFYWMERRDHHVFFAVADCTGHGVPGAMVSVVCSNALNHAVSEFKLNDPGLILDKVSDLVQQTFAKSKSDVNDGMDISLIVMETRKREIQWAGANNSLWLVQHGKLNETKANKQPIGRHENKKPFTTHTFNVQTGDVAYLFTDGFADQFGGPKGKKFKYKQLMKTVADISGLPANKQEDLLVEKFELWRGELEQVDDVCMAGIRFN